MYSLINCYLSYVYVLFILRLWLRSFFISSQGGRYVQNLSIRYCARLLESYELVLVRQARSSHCLRTAQVYHIALKVLYLGLPLLLKIKLRKQKSSLLSCSWTSKHNFEQFGYNVKNAYHFKYPNVGSVTKSISYSFDDRAPTPPLLKKEVEENTEVHFTEDRESEYIPSTSDSLSILFDQNALDYLVRDLGLPKDKSELLGSRLQERNLLSPGTTFSWYRHREQSLIKYFSEGDNYVFCNDVSNFMQKLGVLYDASQWRLFFDSSKTSLKGVLLHNSNEYASISIFFMFMEK